MLSGDWRTSEEVRSMKAVNGVGGRLFTINRVMERRGEERRDSNQPQPRLSIIHRGVSVYSYSTPLSLIYLIFSPSSSSSSVPQKKKVHLGKEEKQMKSLQLVIMF